MNKIKKDIDKLFSELKEKEVYKNYVSVKKQLEDNKEISNIINEIRRLQKIVTNNEDDNIEIDLKKLYDKLNSYPIYQSYIAIKEELEEELFNIKEPLEKYFNDILKLNEKND